MAENLAIEEMARKAKAASRFLGTTTTETRNRILQTVADLLVSRKTEIQIANDKDLKAGREKGLSSAMLDRLALTDEVIAGMRQGINEIIALPDPIGEISTMTRRPNGIMVGRMRIPLGVIGMIYESRPNVTIDAAALCII